MWYVYLLHNFRTNRTYVGATTNPARRLRQHRGEIKGGAKATRKEQEHWRMVLFLEGFQDRTEAYRWEKLIKSRASGLRARMFAFQQVSQGQCPKHPKKPHLPYYQVPTNLVLKYLDQNADK